MVSPKSVPYAWQRFHFIPQIGIQVIIRRRLCVSVKAKQSTLFGTFSAATIQWRFSSEPLPSLNCRLKFLRVRVNFVYLLLRRQQ